MSKRILFILAGTRQEASPRYRAIQFIPYLEKHGFQAELHFPAEKPSGIKRVFATIREEREIIRKARRNDIVFIQKRLFRPAFVKQLKRYGAKLVFDFDDSILTSQNAHRSTLTRLRSRNRFHAICEHADLILAGNQYLAEQAGHGRATVKVLPTVIDAARYVDLEQKGDIKEIVLGWIGQPVNYGYLQALAPVLARLGKAHPNIKLRVISRGEFKMDGIPLETLTWQEHSEVHDLAQVDIGLMPIPDNEWARGKCALKAIQYMATGLPTVCSDIGANREVVRDGIDGFLAGDESEWFDALERLITDPALRNRMGAAARARAIQHFSLHETAKHMIAWLNELADRDGETRIENS